MRLMILPLLFAVGCVSQETYQAALDKNTTLENQNNELEGQVQALRARLTKQREAYDAIFGDLKPLIDKGLLKVETRDGRIVIGMASDVLFASGSATLSDSGKSTITEVARALARHADHEFQVEGHTDSQPISTAQFPDNYYLGAARAITVTEYMVSQGFPKGKISAATFADAAPITTNETDAGRAQNRRIELVLLPDLSDMGAPPAGGGQHRGGGAGGGGGRKKH